MTRDHDPMALLAAEPTGPAAAPLRDRIAAELCRRQVLGHHVHGQMGQPVCADGREAAGVAIRMVAEAAAASTTAPALDISQVDALKLLYARLTGENSALGRAAYAVLRFHYVLPGPGTAEPGCSFCAGAGERKVDDLGPQHCHCRCDCCACGDPLCLGPCDTLGVLLDELVPFGAGVPAGAVDVPRLLARLHADAIRRIAGAAIASEVGRGQLGEVEQDSEPGAVLVHVSSTDAAAAAEGALRRAGYPSERVGEAGLLDAIHGIRIRVRPPAEPALS